MNIFVLSTSPRLCARYRCDKHVVKMILESTQLLCTYFHTIGRSRKWMYKSTHINHPCSVWLRKRPENVQWLIELATELGNEFERRYNHEHKTMKIIRRLVGLVESVPLAKPIGFVFCGPDKIRVGSTVSRYRKLYLLKSKTMKVEWRHSTKPVWFRRK